MKVSRRHHGWIPVAIALAFVFAVSPCLWASGPAPNISADEALAKLKSGNERFVSGSVKHPNQDAARRKSTATQGQQPYATVLACSDSRVPVEMLFDSGIGDIFVIRVAGNVSDVDEMGSIEYAADHLGTPLLVVLGHTKCGAVTAAVQEATVHDHIPNLLDKIEPAVEKAKAANPKLSGDALLDEAIKANVWQSIEDILRESETINKLTKAGKVKVVGAIYDIEKGSISWLGPHPDQAKILTEQ